MPGHMKELLKQVEGALSPPSQTVRPRLTGSILPPKAPKMKQRVNPVQKESPYKFL